MKLHSIVIPHKGRFKGFQCMVVGHYGDGSNLVKIAYGNDATYEWRVDLEIVRPLPCKSKTSEE